MSRKCKLLIVVLGIAITIALANYTFARLGCNTDCDAPNCFCMVAQCSNSTYDCSFSSCPSGCCGDCWVGGSADCWGGSGYIGYDTGECCGHDNCSCPGPYCSSYSPNCGEEPVSGNCDGNF